ncbi:polyprenyl synthetase family protein [Weeksellaceae bacterium KMM 9713]|uniref:Polyprenyl synthetase family protein n=1 Tax=Profundicola chukchiensis TaxID=2961959 RepID=A0A9X4MU82_9FLAO|nr:polyprenyl synthetase family protein [Profundicola chukchiensis]MDG4944933.1 polyprenyl synthetase family protein [Profundicola chukchiensis]
MKYLNQYVETFQEALKQNEFKDEPKELYEPINYILTLGGKRLRPIITLMATDLFGGDMSQAIKPSLAIEYFHNFTLMHDDIMDKAPLRRGKTTVHEKYNVDRAILSGDALLIKAYQYFEDLPDNKFKEIVTLFSKTGQDLCEGQQYDMNFETQLEVTEEEYMKMIYYKTGVLTAASFKIGAIIADASPEDANHIFDFGKHLGIAFQLKDDLLDVYGDSSKVGKMHAGDIFENKKTILFIKALEKANEEQATELRYWYKLNTENIDKVYSVENIFKQLRVDHMVEREILEHTKLAKQYLEKIEGIENKKVLKDFCDDLIGRSF